MITMVPNYKTSDGKSHESVEKAVEHEHFIALVQMLDTDEGTMSPSDQRRTAALIVDNWDAIRTIMERDLKGEMVADAKARVEKDAPRLPLRPGALLTTNDLAAKDAYGTEIKEGFTVKPAVASPAAKELGDKQYVVESVLLDNVEIGGTVYAAKDFVVIKTSA